MPLMQNKNDFRTWLTDRMNECDALYEHPAPDVEVWLRCGTIAHEAGDRAARVGLADLHQCSREFGGFAEPPSVKSFLASCLAALPTEPKQPAALLSVEDVASTLQISVSHVYRLADGGRMPRPMKLGGLVRWDRTELEAWISTRCKSFRSKRAS
jgi:excisionase family DNA binding protein